MKGFLLSCSTVVVGTAVVSGCAEPQPTYSAYSPPIDTRISAATLSKQLQQGMTEAQVTALREPDRVTLETCGQQTAKPWKCKGYSYSGLTVLFQQVQSGAWLVNSWF